MVKCTLGDDGRPSFDLRDDTDPLADEVEWNLTQLSNRRQIRRPGKPAAGAVVPGRFSIGKLSPVSTASLTKKSAASRMMPSAGTRLPADNNTTSPGTTSSIGTSTVCPSRLTRARVRTRA